MRRNSIFKIIITMTLIAAMLLASCGKSGSPSDLESFINSNPEVVEEINSKAAQEQGLSVEISGNEIIYTYDLSQVENAKEDELKDKDMIDRLGKGTDELKDGYVSMCQTLEQISGIKGIKAVVRYTYGDEELLSKTYTSAD